MINFFIGFLFVGILSAFWTAFFGVVTVLPFGLEEPINFFMGIVNNLRNLMPWLNTLWTIFIYGLLFVKIPLWVLGRVVWIIGIIRGGG